MTYIKNFKNKNNNPKINEEQVLKCIRESDGITFIEIAKKLRIPAFLNFELSEILNNYLSKKLIDTKSDEKYIAIYFLTKVQKEISITAKRLGFIDFEMQEESQTKVFSAFLAPFQLKAVLDKDLLLANIYYYYENGIKKYKGDIIQILNHARKTIVGTIEKSANKLFFNAYDEKDRAKFEIINEKECPDITKLKNSLVSCEILKPNNKKVAIAYKNIIGNINDKEHVIKKIIAQNDVNVNFPQNLLEYVSSIPSFVSQEEINSRINLIDLMTVTIDGLDTKDFDDAISCYKNEKNNWKLFIHIADVSYYVKENDLIDNEALLRGTSIYLPDRVIPMLPVELSNGICSLNPNEVRACITLELEIDKQGNNISYKIYPSVIKSNYRLTYNEVNDFYSNIKSVPDDVANMLLHARDLAKIIRSKKISEGYVDFEIQESKVIMEGTKVVDIKVKEEGESEKLIEDFMVRANETVAQMMTNLKIPSIYRIHEKPSPEKLTLLQELFNFCGFKDVKVPYDGEPKSFGEMIAKLKEHKFDDFIKMALLRTMQKAIYSSNNIGHFGLASKAYSHFTSPIRRYPDLLLHRLIRTYIFEKKEITPDLSETLKQKISQIALMNSESEKNAMVVERSVVDVRKSEFFENLINKQFFATLVSIEKFGMFFNIDEYQTSVLVRFENLAIPTNKDNDFQASSKNKIYKAGNKYLITITSIDHEKGNVNATLA